jgi:Dolichyl-phosphate-mannose-protein mannosyltransferase
MDPGQSSGARRPAVASRRIGIAIFLTFFGLFLLSSGRQPPFSDSNALWQVADHLITRGSITVDVRWNAPPGRDGKIYGLLPLVDSLAHVPGAALRVLAAKIAPGIGDVVLPLASHFGSAILGALTCVLFFRLARRFTGVGAASAATVLVGLGSLVWYYARSPYTEIFQTFAFTGYALAFLDALDDPSAPAGRRLGLWAGLLFSTKLVYVIALPGVAAVFAWRWRREPRRLLVFFGWAALMLVPFVVVILLYNWARWGSLLDTGYGPIGGGSIWRGLWGLFFSPGKSVFLYNPPLVLAAAFLPRLARRNAAFVVALIAAFVPPLLVNARFAHWDGDWAWGPRYLTFAVPAFCVPLALAVEAALAARAAHRRILGALLAGLLAAGVAVQVIGAAFHWGYFFRIGLAVSESWLGQPRCAPGPKPCYPDDADIWALHWLPELQPIAGHFWLLRHVPFGDPWDVADADAPWQMDGRIHAPAAASWYEHTVIDWWPIAWGRYPVTAAVLASLMAASVGLGVFRWRRGGG